MDRKSNAKIGTIYLDLMYLDSKSYPLIFDIITREYDIEVMLHKIAIPYGTIENIEWDQHILKSDLWQYKEYNNSIEETIMDWIEENIWK